VNDPLLVVHPFESFYYRWYLGPAWPMQGLVFTALDEQDTYVIKPPPLDLAMARARVERVARGHPRFWVIGQSTKSFASDAADEARLFDWLDRRYSRLVDLGRLTDGDPTIRLYGVPPGTAGRSVP
jgi:hypothetical protein